MVDTDPLPSRSVRRHHHDRIKHNRRFHWGRHRDLSLEPEIWARAIDTPTPCSCYMCGNPRKHFEQKTMQERREAFKKLTDFD